MMPFRSGLAAGDSASRIYWRILELDNYGDATGITVGDIAMRSAPGGANILTGGTASASKISAGGSVGSAYDGSFANFWFADSAPTNQWFQYQFPSAIEVVEIALGQGTSVVNPFTRMPKNGKLQKSSDGATWEDVFTFQVPGAFVLGKYYSFPETPAAAGYHRAWRLSLTGTSGGSELSDIEFRATAGGADQTAAVPIGDGNASGRGITSSQGAGAEVYRLYDGSAATYWFSGSNNQWAGYVFPDPVKVEELSIIGPKNVASRSGTGFLLQYSDDLVTWTTQKTVTGLSWSIGETKVISAL